MSPFLFPLVMVLFGELSVDRLTRFTARVLFYGYCFSLIVSMVLPSTSLTLIPVCLCYIISYIVVGYKVKFTRIRILLVVLAVLQLINYTSLYYVNYSMYYAIPYYFEYSNIILRETTISCVALCTMSRTIDAKLKFCILIAYAIEYSYLLVF